MVHLGIPTVVDAVLTEQTELLNCHMSIGFIIPVVMLCRGPFSDARTIGMIIVGFSE